MRRGILLLLPAALCAAAAPDYSPSRRTEEILSLARARAEESPAARRLFASTRRVPRREARGRVLMQAIETYGGKSPELLVDGKALAALRGAEVEILLILNCARAALAFPLPTVEAEQAAWRIVLRFAVERATGDPAGFGAALTAAEAAARPGGRLPDEPLERTAALIALFERAPSSADAAIEASMMWRKDVVRLSEIEDLYQLRGKELAKSASAGAGPYAFLGGHRYPAALVAAARSFGSADEVERLRESLEAYDAAGAASLRLEISRWRRSAARR